MKINKSTMLFEELTEQEATELEICAETLILTGQRNSDTAFYFNRWLKECDLDERQGLLLLGTVFPARALLSVIRFRKGR